MTVKELIQELLEYDMDSEVEVNCTVDEYTDEQFDFDVKEDYRISGKNKVFINFELNGEVLGSEEV